MCNARHFIAELLKFHCVEAINYIKCAKYGAFLFNNPFRFIIFIYDVKLACVWKIKEIEERNTFPTEE